MAASAQILIVDDDVQLAGSLRKVLERSGYAVRLEHDGVAGLRAASETTCDLVLTDLRMPGLGGLELVARIHETRPRLPVILLTAFGTAETAIEATRRGAYDYLLKPFEMPELLELVARALEQTRLARGQGVVLADEATPGHTGPALIGRSRPMQDLYKEIGRAAAGTLTVLIRGETGTGKELVARAIHEHSARRTGPFIAINCAALAENLLESELFGHEKGAFTGADRRRIGRFEQAHGGTLFLDEIGDISPAVQVRLLRVLQERAIQRVGGGETLPVDVRVVAATHRHLEQAIEAGQFREDLFYRLNAVQLRLPALRERPGDIPGLATHFLARAAAEAGTRPPGIEEEALQLLAAHAWPGNVRQLENTVRQLTHAAHGLVITAAQVRALLGGTGLNPEIPGAEGIGPLVARLLDEAVAGQRDDAHAAGVAALEAELFRQALVRAEGNLAQMARWLGLSRLTLRERLKHHGLYTPPPGHG